MPQLIGEDTANLEAMSAAVRYCAAMRRLVRDQLSLAERVENQGPIIDFGSGKSEYAKALAQETPQNYLCVEPQWEGALACSAIKHYKSLAPIAERSAAGAYSLNVFEHIADDVQALHELAQKVMRNGLIFLLVPAHPQLWTNMDTAVGHKRRYTIETLRALGVTAGLSIQAEGWFDHTGYAATRILQTMTRLKLRSKTWSGRVTTTEIKTFDAVFGTLEPLLRRSALGMGKNRWILLRVA